jgi:RNA polymerase sigma factor (sigma-70 family)
VTIPLPESIAALRAAASGALQEDAWSQFLADYSDVLLYVARRMGGGHDEVMDRYAWVLDGLRRDDFRRLRGYDGKGPGPFSTWLIVVVRRLCLDLHRTRYGRPQAEAPTRVADWQERRRLVDLIGDALAVEALETSPHRAADTGMVRRETLDSLERVLEELDPEDRLLLRIRFEDGVSVPQMARALGFNEPFGLYRRLDKILKGLRTRLQVMGIDDARL